MRVNRKISLLCVVMMTGCGGSVHEAPTALSLSDIPADSCMDTTYTEDAVNEPKSIILPVSLNRARELITDGAMPFGFSMPADFDTEADFLTNSNLLVKLDAHHEPMIYVKLDPVTTGNAPSTRITVDTISTRLVMKGRHHPYAGSIIQHTACLYNLIDIRLKAGKNIPRDIIVKPATSVDLILARAVTSHTAHIGGKVPFIVAHDVLQDGQLVIAKGTRAWGKITDLKAAGSFMKGGKLALEITHVQGTGMHKIPLRFKDMTSEEKSKTTGGSLAVTGLTGGLIMVATVGLILPFIDGAQAVMRAGTEISVETALSE